MVFLSDEVGPVDPLSQVVLARGFPLQIFKSVVALDAVQVRRLKTVARTNERFENNAMDESLLRRSVASAKSNGEIPFADLPRLHDSGSDATRLNFSVARNRVPIEPGNITPLRFHPINPPNTEASTSTRPCNNQQECGVFATASAILLDSSDSVIG